MITIACLHTAWSNVELFEGALARADLPGGLDRVVMHHVVRRELLAQADLDGTAREVLSLSSGAEAVLVTCSTIGAGAEHVAPVLSIPVARADRALADAAVASAGAGGADGIRVLYAAPSTRETTTRLFDESTVGVDVNVELVFVDGAWASFEAGDLDGYVSRVAEVASAQPSDAVVALAQSSMAPAASVVTRPVLDVPTVSVNSMLRRLVA